MRSELDHRTSPDCSRNFDDSLVKSSIPRPPSIRIRLPSALCHSMLMPDRLALRSTAGANSTKRIAFRFARLADFSLLPLLPAPGVLDWLSSRPQFHNDPE